MVILHEHARNPQFEQFLNWVERFDSILYLVLDKQRKALKLKIGKEQLHFNATTH